MYRNRHIAGNDLTGFGSAYQNRIGNRFFLAGVKGAGFSGFLDLAFIFIEKGKQNTAGNRFIGFITQFDFPGDFDESA